MVIQDREHKVMVQKLMCIVYLDYSMRKSPASEMVSVNDSNLSNLLSWLFPVSTDLLNLSGLT